MVFLNNFHVVGSAQGPRHYWAPKKTTKKADTPLNPSTLNMKTRIKQHSGPSYVHRRIHPFPRLKKMINGEGRDFGGISYAPEQDGCLKEAP